MSPLLALALRVVLYGVLKLFVILYVTVGLATLLIAALLAAFVPLDQADGDDIDATDGLW